MEEDYERVRKREREEKGEGETEILCVNFISVIRASFSYESAFVLSPKPKRN